MAQTVWKGRLAFGDLSVPVKTVAAARKDQVSFSLVNPATGSGTSQKLVDRATGEELSRSDLVKSTTSDDGRTVYLTQEDLDGLKLESCSVMEVLSTVKVADVDPLYFDSSYYVLPDGTGGDYPYHALIAALHSLKAGALVKMCKGQRESLALIRAVDGMVVLHTLFYAGEIRPCDDSVEPVLIAPEDLKLAKSFVRAAMAEFDPWAHRDAYRDELNKLIAEKAIPGGDLREVLKGAIKTAKRAKKALLGDSGVHCEA